MLARTHIGGLLVLLVFLTTGVGFAQDAPAPSAPRPMLPVKVPPSDPDSPERERLEQVVLGQLKLLGRLLRRTGANDPEMADFRWRAANLQLDMVDRFESRARALDESLFQAERGGKTQQAATLRKKRSEHEKQRDLWEQRAVRSLSLAANNPALAQANSMEHILFLLASLRFQQAEKFEKSKRSDAIADAKKYFQRLVSDHVGSAHVPASHFYLAEMAFDEGKLPEAAGHYEKSLRSQENSNYAGYALYKKGFCYLRLQQALPAKEAFVAAVDWAKQHAEDVRLGRFAKPLMRQAADAFVRAYAMEDGFAAAPVALQTLAPTLAGALLRELAARYEEVVRYDQAIAAYLYLIEKNASDPARCVWHQAVVKNQLALTGGLPDDQTLAYVDQMLAYYRQRPTGLEQAAEAKAATCWNQAKPLLQDAVLAWHQHCLKALDLVAGHKALALYDRFLSILSPEEQWEARFWMAELIWKMGELDPNSDHACKAAVIYADLTRQPGKPVPEARDLPYIAVAAWEQCVAFRAKSTNAAAGKEALAAAVQAFETAANFYLEKRSSDAHRPEVLHAAALMHLTRGGHPEQALPLIAEIVSRYPEDAVFEPAVRMLMDIWRKDPRVDSEPPYVHALVAQCLSLEQAVNLVPRSALFLQEFSSVYFALFAKEAEMWTKEGRHDLAAERYQWLLRNDPGNAKRAAFQLNAAVSLRKAGHVQSAIDQVDDFVHEGGEKIGSLQAKALYLSGHWLYEITRYVEAIPRLQRAIDHLPEKSDESEWALLALAQIYFHQGQVGEYLAATGEWVRRFGTADQTRDKQFGVLWGRIEALQPSQRASEPLLRQELDAYLASHPKTAAWQLGLIQIEKGLSMARESCPQEEQHGLCVTQKTLQPGSNVCALEKRPFFVPLPRDAALLAQARTLLQQGTAALRSESVQSDKAAPHALLRRAVARARFAEASEALEQLVAHSFPRDLSGDAKKAAAAKQKVDAWFQQSDALQHRVKAAYQQVVDVKDPDWTVAALHQIALGDQVVFDAVATAPLPKIPPAPRGMGRQQWEEAFQEQYCNQWSTLLNQLRDQVDVRLQECQRTATDLGMTGPWFESCGQSLSLRKPLDFPPIQEDLGSLDSFAKLPIDLLGSIDTNDPALGEALFLYGQALKNPTQPADWHRIVRVAQESVGRHPNSVPALFLIAQGKMILRDEKYPLSLLFAQAPQREFSLLYLRGVYALQRKETAAAYAALKQAMALRPEQTVASLAVARAALRLGRATEAQGLFQKMTQSDAAPGIAWLGLGVSQRMLRQWQAADSAYRSALDHPETACAAQYNRGVLWGSGFTIDVKAEDAQKKASEAYNAFLQCAPSTETARRGQAQQWLQIYNAATAAAAK